MIVFSTSVESLSVSVSVSASAVFSVVDASLFASFVSSPDPHPATIAATMDTHNKVLISFFFIEFSSFSFFILFGCCFRQLSYRLAGNQCALYNDSLYESSSRFLDGINKTPCCFSSYLFGILMNRCDSRMG